MQGRCGLGVEEVKVTHRSQDDEFSMASDLRLTVSDQLVGLCG
jgi:hypothetical protein